MKAFLEFFHSLLAALHSWCMRDRIRVSPAEGRLLQAKIGDRLLTDAQLYIVDSRTWTQDSQSRYLHLALRQLDENQRLYLDIPLHQRPGSPRMVVAKWTDGKPEMTMREDAFLVIGNPSD